MRLLEISYGMSAQEAQAEATSAAGNGQPAPSRVKLLDEALKGIHLGGGGAAGPVIG